MRSSSAVFYFIRDLQWEKIFAAVLIFALWTQYQKFSGRLFGMTSDLAVVSANDNDSGAAVEVTLRTNLINDNGWRIYGPIYYKLASLMRFFSATSNSITKDITKDITKETLDDRKALEKNTHYQLLSLNLISLYFVGFILASFFLNSLHWSLLMTYLFVPLTLLNPNRLELLLTAKPDFLFCLFLTASLIFLVRFLADRRKESLNRFSFLWGVTSATKLAVLFYIPSFLFLAWHLRKRSKIGFQFLIFFSVGYFVLGLPQTWDLPGGIQYLVDQHKNSSWGHFSFFKEWIKLFQLELLWIPWLILFFYLLGPVRKINIPLKTFFSFTWFVALAFLFLVLRKLNPPYHWYTFPITQGILVWWILLFESLNTYFGIKYSLASFLRRGRFFFQRLQSSRWFFGILLGLAPQIGGLWPTHFETQAHIRVRCSEEVHAVEKILNQAAALPEAQILVDPVLPYDRQFHDKTIFSHWDMDLNRISESTTWIALKKDYYQTYLNQGPGNTGQVAMHLRDIEQTKLFYRLFNGQTQALDPLGQRWSLAHKDSCGFELWEKQTRKK